MMKNELIMIAKHNEVYTKKLRCNSVKMDVYGTICAQGICPDYGILRIVYSVLLRHTDTHSSQPVCPLSVYIPRTPHVIESTPLMMTVWGESVARISSTIALLCTIITHHVSVLYKR
jgi:hypothetical protein